MQIFADKKWMSLSLEEVLDLLWLDCSVQAFESKRKKLTPLEKAEAERILSHQNKQYRQQIMQKEYDDKLKTMKYEEKNKGVLATFLKIKN